MIFLYLLIFCTIVISIYIVQISVLNAQLSDLKVGTWNVECLENFFCLDLNICLKIYYLKKCYKKFPCIYIDFYHNLCNVYRFKIKED